MRQNSADLSYAIFLFLCLLGHSNLVAQDKKVIYCGQIFHSLTGKMEQEMTVTIQADTIANLEKGYIPQAANINIYDLRAYTVLPGLIDCHVHLEWEQNRSTYSDRFMLNPSDIAFRSLVYAHRTIEAGFTTVRDLGGSGVNTALRTAINTGWAKGPRIYSANKSLAITGGHGDHTNGAADHIYDPPTPSEGIADGPDACRLAVRQQVKKGADLIKITATGGVLSMSKDGRRPQFQDDELKAIIATATDLGVKVAAHAHGDEGIKRAVEAGVASIEHGTFMSESSMQLMKSKGTFYVPTLTAGWSVTDSARIKGFFPEMVRLKAEGIGPKIQETTKNAYQFGVKIAFGTDAGVYPHGKNGLEFIYLHNAGIPNAECIRMATVHAAELIGIQDKAGSIQPGKWADIIAIEGNPLEQIEAMLRIKWVMKGGEVLYQKD
jgi:imidazolonepropionase-like amidohydrolase